MKGGAVDAEASDPTGLMMNGMPASVFGDSSTKREGMWSVWDSDRYKANEKALMSAPSATSFIPLDERGKPFPAGTLYRHRGKLYRLNADSALRIVDTAQHRRNQRYAEMMDARISEIAELVLSSDHDAMSVLGLDSKDYEELFGPKATGPTRPNVKAFLNAWKIPEDILRVDARVRTMRLRPRDSEAYVTALAKVRSIIQNIMPALDDSHISESTLKDLGDDAYQPEQLAGGDAAA